MQFKKISLTFLLISLLFLFLELNIEKVSANLNQENIPVEKMPEKLKERMNVQAEVHSKVFSNLDAVYGNLEEFEKLGVIYGDETGGLTIGFNVKNKSINQKEKEEKFKERIKNSKMQHIDKVKIIDTTYTTQELKDLQEEILKDFVSLNINGQKNAGVETGIKVKDKIIRLRFGNLSDANKEFLLNKYGDVIEITVDDSEVPEKTVARERDWTKLGGGIRMHDGGASHCTTGAIAKKGSNHFIITAGHCIDGGGSHVLQDGALVGRDHTSGYASGYDLGLVRITEDAYLISSSGKWYSRIATNHLYISAEDNTDYDARMTGWGYTVDDLAVCKSGITSDKTCGLVTNAYATIDYSDPEPSQIVARVATYTCCHATFSELGDSGAPVFNNANHVLYGIVSGRAGTDVGYFTRITVAMDKYSGPGDPFTIYTSNTDTRIGSYY